MGRFMNAVRCFFRALKNGDSSDSQQKIPLEDAKLLLSFLQEEGRLVDFLQEDISSFEDEQIGSAVREIHSKTARALQQVFTIEAVTEENEGDTIKIAENFDKNAVKLVGNVSGKPPFHGTIKHHGWKIVAHKELPKRQDSSIIMPAEVEI